MCPAATFLLLTLSGIACGDGSETTDDGLGAVVEDSAGVTIVSNDRPPPDSRLPWTFGAQPSLSIGAVEGDETDQLFRIRDATRLADGRIVIANGGSNELRVFNPDGSHSATWGGRGEGPGEFTSGGPTAVALWPGDSIAAPNAGPRLSLFDMNGNHGRDVAFDATRSNVLDLLPAGRIVSKGSLLLHPDGSGKQGRLVRYYTEWTVLDANGTLQASLGQFPLTEDWVAMVDADGSTWESPHPFGRGTVGAVWGDLVAIAVQDSYEIKAFAADGSLVRIVRRAGDPRTATQADQDEYFARLVADRPPEERAEALRSVRDVPLVDSYPAFEGILADRVGYLWVREYRMFGEGNAVWTVFDSEGRVQGLVETPAGLNVFEIGGDYVLGSATDELGVEYVQVWALSREVEND